jgi:N-acylneuraminate cytidylyltransferase/CMP-N,N'-diacetyllegionaminic acid synthase
MIAIIPARGGSKGLPGKNIKMLNGKPLIAYTIESALASKFISDVIISTDDQLIHDIAVKYGATSTFLRPKELAEDDSQAIDNYVYTIDRLKNEYGYTIESFVVLQPTSPLRTSEDINAAIELFMANEADSVITYCEEHHPVSWHKYIDGSNKISDIFPCDMLENRQKVKPTYYPNGAIYVFRESLIKSRRYYSDKTFAYIMPRSRSIDIDTIEDFEYANFLLSNKNESYNSL